MLFTPFIWMKMENSYLEKSYGCQHNMLLIPFITILETHVVNYKTSKTWNRILSDKTESNVNIYLEYLEIKHPRI